ncbi:hypothetical protein ACHAWT_007516 [Skeletonema menzelii]
MKASRRSSAAERSFRSATTSISSASSVGSRVKRSHERRRSSGSGSVTSLQSGTAVSASQSAKASRRNRSVASHDAYSVGSQLSTVSAASTKSQLSNDDSISPRRSNSVSSRRSTLSALSFQEQLESLADGSQRSGSDRSGERSSPRSVASHVSRHSNHSRRSHRSSSSRKKSSMSNSHRSLASTNSRKSASVASQKSVNSNRGNKISSLQQKGKTQLEGKHYAEAIKSFTLAIRTCDPSQDWSGSDDDNANGTGRTMTVLYRYRCESLYEIGLYDLAVADARKALKFEQSTTKSDLSDRLVLRGKLLSLLGYSLLRTGNNLESAKKAFDDSIQVTKEAINEVKLLSESGQPSKSLVETKRLLTTTLGESKAGLNEIVTYESLNGLLKDSSQKDIIKNLDSVLVITPGKTDLHLQKIKHLIKRKRWFEVANHCEQLAAKASKYCGVEIFKGDLQDANPFPGMKLEELDPAYFTRSNTDVPQYLRVLPAAATREAVSLLPKELLPYYITSLRLEDRCDAAILVGRDLQKSGVSVGRIAQEWEKVNETIKLREQANVFFRNGEFSRAASLYKQCLQVCSETNSGGQINAVLHYNRGKCFYAMSQYQDACTEFTHAISIHSMYSDAILKRARCYIQMKDRKKASANFNRYLTLVEGANELPYPPKNKGSNCFFDMPSDVTYRQVESVRAEMKKHKLADISNDQKHNNAQLFDFSSFTERLNATFTGLNATFTELCCKKGVANQVVVKNRPKARQDLPRPAEIADGSNLRSSLNSRTSGTKIVRFLGDPPSRAPSMKSSDPRLLQSEFDTNGGREP